MLLGFPLYLSVPGCRSSPRCKIDVTWGRVELRHNRIMPVEDCFEQRRASIYVSVVDVGLCSCRRQERLDYQCITTASDLKQLGVSIVSVLFNSNSTSTIRIEHSLVFENQEA